MPRQFTLSVLLASLAAWATTGSPSFAKQDGAAARLRAVDVLREALREADAPDLSPNEKLDVLARRSQTAAEAVGRQTFAARRLAGAVEEASAVSREDPRRAVAQLRDALSKLKSDLEFRVRSEAELPAGFPPPTTVGEVEIKRYPAYRMARTETASNGAFWTLFSHIKRHNIAMTAPVEMGYAPGAEDGARAKSMAFLYGDPGLGTPGTEGAVEVVDVAPMTVASTGVRGAQTRQSVDEARRRLDAWLESNQGTWTATGPMRVMGHNSPFVPREQNYFEVQIPVRESGKPGGEGNDNAGE
ncbi:MAG: heme-binding protein [Pirellulales bacterium]|nr:heme-binding protein [Pirellulales bacterium]